MAFIGVGGEVAWYCPSLDNTNGGVNDLSGNGNTGTAVGSVATTADTGSGGSHAFEVNATSKGITIPVDIIDGLTEYSLSIWVKLTSVASSTSNIFGAYKSGNSDSNPSFLWRTSSRLSVFGITDGGAVSGGDMSNPQSLNVWTHLTLRYKLGEGLEAFQDGVQVYNGATGVVLTGAGTVTFSIGKSSLNAALMLADDARVFHHELTQSDITLLASTRGYTSGGPPPADPFYNPFINKRFNPNYNRRIG